MEPKAPLDHIETLQETALGTVNTQYDRRRNRSPAENTGR